MAEPAQNIRPLSTGERFTLLAGDVIDVMGAFGYTDRVADFAVCQAALETDRFRSDLFLRANNAFGMRIANVRPQPIIGASNGYAVYDTVRDSVADYFDRQRAFRIPNTNNADEYIAATVASGYTTAAHYGQAWKALLRQVELSDFGTAFDLQDMPFVEPQAPPSGGSLAVLALLAYLAAQ